MTEPDKHPLPISGEESTAAGSALEENTPAGSDDAKKLRTLVGEYEARLDEVAELVARVRHEINNPLTGVLGQAQLMLREELPERTRKRVEKIEQLAVRIRDIVSELRQVQRTPKI